MSLSSLQPQNLRKELQDALIDAFRDQNSLEQMLSLQLDENINVIAGEGNLNNIVFKLIQTAEANGWVPKLIAAAYMANSGNPKLDKFVRERLYPSLDNTFSNNSNQEKYQRIDTLATGIYTEVHLVENDLNKKLVLKELHNARIKDKFIKTIKDAFVISEIPNFITIYDFGVSSAKKPYYVMQYIKGEGSLRDYFNKNINFSCQEVINIILRIGYAMIKAQEKDESPSYLNIKPSDIMIDKKKEPFISAFNLCVNLELDDIIPELQPLFDKNQKKFKEELTYLLPEKFNGTGVTKKADQYMLGLLIYELITKKMPPSIKDINNINNINISTLIQELSELSELRDGGKVFQRISFHDGDVDKEYPDEIKDIILKMTDLDPNQRFKDLKEALDTIDVYSRFTDTRKTIHLVKESFRKCMSNDENDPSFFKRFYDKFINEPGVSEKFGNRNEDDWKKHHKSVEKAIVLFFYYYEEEKIFGYRKTTGTEESFSLLDYILEPHINLDISKELFDSFQETLIDSVIEYNDKSNDEIYINSIKSAWKEVLQPGFDYIQSKSQNKNLSEQKTCPYQRLPAYS